MAETTMEVRARLSAETAQFQKSMDEARKSTETFQEASSSLSSALTSVGLVASGTAIALIAFGVKSFRAAAQVQELDIALQAIGKSSRYGYSELATAVDAIQDAGITAAASQRAIIKLAQSNVDLSKATELATVAQNLSVTASVNSADALQTLIFAITTGQTRMLRQIGITTGATEAYDIYARSIGKATNQLTMAERRQAVLNLILREGTKVSGAYALAIQSPSKALKEMSDVTNNLQVAVGKRLLDAFSKLVLSAYALYNRFAQAANGTGNFAKVLDAMQMVFTKLADPFARLLDNLGAFIDKIDKGRVSTIQIAETMEKVLPIAAAFATFFGIRAGKSLAQAAPFFQGFFQTLARFNLVFTAFVLAVTSPQLRGAIEQLVKSFSPLLPTLKKLSAILTEVSALVIGTFAKAISTVSSLISGGISFVQKYATAFKILGAALIIVTAGVLAYLAQVKLVNLYTAIQTALTTAQATATGFLTRAQLGLNAAMAMNPVGAVIAGIGALVAAIVIAYNTSEQFRVGFTNAFNAVASIGGRVIAFQLRNFGYLLKAYGSLIDVNNTYGQVIASVMQFVYSTVLTVFLGVIKAIKFVMDAFISLMENNDTFRQVVIAVFDAVIRVIAAAVTFIVASFANILKAVATGVYIFEKFVEVVKFVGKAIVGAVAFLGKAIFNIFKTIGSGVGNFLADAIEKVKSWVQSLASLLSKIPKIGDIIAGVVSGIASVGDATVRNLRNLGDNLSDALFGSSESSAKKSIDGISAVSSSVIKLSKSWGNYTEGAAGAISSVANKMLDFNMKLVDFAAQDNGSKIVNGLISGAKIASEGLGKVIDQMEKMKDIQVGEFIVKNTSEAAMKAGNFLLNLASGIESFTSGNVIAKIGDGFSGLLDSVKTGLGFGDILAEEKKKVEEASKIGGDTDEALQSITGSVDTMKAIRQAMADGIQSIKDVLNDLQTAAKDFADSLKDTIVGFAGLKGVELPDGFIPKAKSLIENMQMRLNKTQQFASQIAQLQAYGLDTEALKAIIEEGPIKGAQLASSILGGGAEAIAEINKLQQAISYSGALIGQYGADVAFSGKIANAQSALAGLEAASLSTSTKGGNLFIEQGAVSIVVEASKVGTQEELADLIAQRVNEVFGTLAKELAAK